MAPSRVSKTTRVVALAIAAKGDIEAASAAIREIEKALTLWADELSTDAENLHQTAVGLQAESMRLAMSALTIRAASERLAIVAQLTKDAAGAQ